MRLIRLYNQLWIVRRLRFFIVSIFVFVLTVSFIYIAYTTTMTLDHMFTKTISVKVDYGMTGRQIAQRLVEQGVLRTKLGFEILLRKHGTHIQAGVYTLNPDKITSLSKLVDAMVSGNVETSSVLVFIPEGVRGQGIVDAVCAHTLLVRLCTSIDIQALENENGYLFPDTYALNRNTTTETLIARMKKRYKEKIEPLREEINASPFTEEEVIILASLIEREANSEESMRHVSGILQNRLDIGMALQLDATLHYVFGKTSGELTEEELNSDSPFNTYTHTGLPPAPIANPGLDAIKAVLHPVTSDDFYYLTGLDGNFYYATTFEAHKRNKHLYLR